MAVVETQINALSADVTEIKGDVKSLVATQNQLAIALAIKNAADAQESVARASTGIWVRMFLPLLVSAGALVLGAYNVIKG